MQWRRLQLFVLMPDIFFGAGPLCPSCGDCHGWDQAPVFFLLIDPFRPLFCASVLRCLPSLVSAGHCSSCGILYPWKSRSFGTTATVRAADGDTMMYILYIVYSIAGRLSMLFGPWELKLVQRIKQRVDLDLSLGRAQLQTKGTVLISFL